MNPNDRALRHMYQQYFRSFAQLSFRLLHPNQTLIPAWYLDVIGYHLEECAKGNLKRLIVNLPPRYLKSHYISVAFPAWMLGCQPDTRIIGITGNRALLHEQHNAVYGLMCHPRFRSLYPHLRFNRAPGGIETGHGGVIQHKLTSQSLVGQGADTIIIDDPLSPSDAENPKILKRINDWYDNNVYQRLNNKRDGVIIIVMQRLHVDDLVGHVESNGGWTVLRFPAIAENDETAPFLGEEKVLRAKGDALNLSLESRAQLRNTMLSMKAKPFMAQYQQKPYPSGQGEIRGGCYSSLRKGVPWKVGDRNPEKWFGQMPEEKILLHTVFGEGQHPWPSDMRMSLSMAEWILMNAGDKQRSELIQLMTPEQRETHGIDPSYKHVIDSSSAFSLGPSLDQEFFNYG